MSTTIPTKTILYIEDSKTSQWVLKQKLAKLADITIADTLATSRQILMLHRFDLIIMDWSLPDGKSTELLPTLRTQYSSSQLPIILVSSSLDKNMTIQALQAGVNECQVKPIPWPEFITMLTRMFETPYVNPLVNTGAVVTWIEGFTHNQFWLYCPEINLFLKGIDADIVRQDASNQIQAQLAKTPAMETAREVRITTHRIHRL